MEWYLHFFDRNIAINLFSVAIINERTVDCINMGKINGPFWSIHLYQSCLLKLR